MRKVSKKGEGEKEGSSIAQTRGKEDFLEKNVEILESMLGMYGEKRKYFHTSMILRAELERSTIFVSR